MIYVVDVVDVFSVLTLVVVFLALTSVPFRIMVLFGLGTPLDIHVMVTFLAAGSGVTVKDVILGSATKKTKSLFNFYSVKIYMLYIGQPPTKYRNSRVFLSFTSYI